MMKAFKRVLLKNWLLVRMKLMAENSDVVMQLGSVFEGLREVLPQVKLSMLK